MAADASQTLRIRNVGVLCMDFSNCLGDACGQRVELPHSYIAASYVQSLNAAGAHVVPIWIGRDRSYYESIMNQVNGVLLPGGAVFLDDEENKRHSNTTNSCVESARHIFELAMAKNAAGEYFPLWGTCLGFQLILIHAARSKDLRSDCERMSVALPLQLAKDYRDSVLFKHLPDGMAERMCSEPFACHFHQYCINETNFRQHHLHNDWHVLATRDHQQPVGSGERYITLIEHRQYPIFGSQFHPEKAAYEQLLVRDDNFIPAHTRSCIQLAQYFADSFVDACRRNRNEFPNPEQQLRHMICNWQPIFTGKYPKSAWLQCYVFDKDVDYPKSENLSK